MFYWPDLNLFSSQPDALFHGLRLDACCAVQHQATWRGDGDRPVTSPCHDRLFAGGRRTRNGKFLIHRKVSAECRCRAETTLHSELQSGALWCHSALPPLLRPVFHHSTAVVPHQVAPGRHQQDQSPNYAGPSLAHEIFGHSTEKHLSVQA